MTIPPCRGEHDIFGAGKPGRADPDEAAAICDGCPVKVECLEEFATSTRPEFVPFDMTVAALSGYRLAGAMRRIRERAA